MNELSNLPNAIIAGAPKCGTTSLFNWLADHPEICQAKVKETKYFIDPGYPLYDKTCNYRIGGLRGYEELFVCREACQKVKLEATPDYIYQETPLSCLASLQYPPTIIFVLRKPSERIYSLFRFAQNNMAILPTKMTFQEFIDIIEKNDTYFEKRTILKNAMVHSRYSIYIKKWIEAFGKEQIHVFFFEDMISRHDTFLKNVCGVLKIDQSFYANYQANKDNETISIRLQSIQKLKRKITDRIPDSQLKSILKKFYMNINIKKSKSQKCQEDLTALRNLNLKFLSEIEELHKIVGVYPNSWL